MHSRLSRRGISVETLECRQLLSAAASLAAEGLTHQQILSLYAAGRQQIHNKAHDPLAIVASTLRELYQDDPTGAPLTPLQLGDLESSHGNPAVSVHARGSVSTLLHRLEKLGLSVMDVNARAHLVDGFLPISSIVTAARLRGVSAISAIARPTVHSVGSGVNQAESVQNVAQARTAFNVNGAGVKIGVISDSISRSGGGLADSVASGDLPNNVTVLRDGQVGDTDEGRAILEEIHDMAPGASLYFYSGDGPQDTMASAINALKNAGCRIVVDDLGYLDEPMFQDGVISRAINNFVAGGGSYFSAIGNDGNSGYLHTNTQYTTANGQTFVNWAGNGSTSGETLNFTTTGPIDITLQWDNPYNGDTGAATTDLNVYIYQNNQLVASATDQNLSSGIPEETLNTLSAGSYQMKVQVAAMSSGAAPPDMIKFVAAEDANGGLSYVQYPGIRSSAYGHGSGQNTISVGAVEFASAPPFSSVTPIRNEYYSSTGPIVYAFDANGNKLAAPLTLNKPDVSGVDGVNTSFFGQVTGNDPTSFPQFYGTSAAAPNVAAVAALIDQYRPGATESQILAALKSSTAPLNGAIAGAWDPQGGYGLVNAEKALAWFGATPAAPTASLAAVSTPRQTAIASEAINFNEAVSGFSLSSLSLTRNGGANLLTNAQTLASSDQTHFSLGNLTSLTAAAGAYTLTLNPGGITGGGASMSAGTSISWTNNTTAAAPNVALASVASPRSSPVNSEQITFNVPITGLTLGSLTLRRNLGSNLLTSAQTLTTSNQTTFTLGNLGALTSTPGSYLLTLNPAGISSAGASLAAGATISWQMQATTLGASIGNATAVKPASGTLAMNFPVTLSAPAPSTVTLNYATAPGTATGSDFVAVSSGTLTIPAGRSMGIISITINGNTQANAPRQFSVKLTGAAGASITHAVGTGTILSSGTTVKPTVGFPAATTFIASPSATTTLNIPVTLSSASSVNVTITYATVAGTASTGAGDYSGTASRAITIAAGQKTGRIYIAVARHPLTTRKYFWVKLLGATNATLANVTDKVTLT